VLLPVNDVKGESVDRNVHGVALLVLGDKDTRTLNKTVSKTVILWYKL
jgi:hypothetical protein